MRHPSSRHPFLDLPSPCVLGHRGAAGECPENTLTSFERALTRGAAILETDLQITRDGVPVLLHDPRVERTTNGNGAVADLPLDALRALDAAYHWVPPHARDGNRPPPYRGRGVRIPTLEEALSTFPRARFNLELKDRDPRLIEATLDCVTRCDAARRVLLTAGDDAIMEPLRRAARDTGLDVALGASSGEIGAFLRSALENGAPPAELLVLQVPARFAGDALVTPSFVAHAKRHGIAVHVWTINEAEEMETLLDLGVDGLVTDYPALAIERISRRAAD